MVQNAENRYFTILEIHVRSLYLVLGTWLKYPKEEKYIFRICYHAHSPDICKWRVRGLLLDTFFSFQKYCKDKQAIQKCVCFTFLIETSWALPPFGRYCPQPLMITVQEKQILFYTFYLEIQYQKAPLLLNGYTNIVIPVLEVGWGFLGQILDKNNLNRCHIFTSENIYMVILNSPYEI